MRFYRLCAAVLSGLLYMTAASPGQAYTFPWQQPHVPYKMPAGCDNESFLKLQKAFADGRRKKEAPVHICGPVIAVSKKRHTRSGWHGYFYVKLERGISIRVVSNLDEMQAPAWPWVAKGDQVEVAGRYYFDNIRRQGIDWTHKGTGRKWPFPGYVKVNGALYQ